MSLPEDGRLLLKTDTSALCLGAEKPLYADDDEANTDLCSSPADPTPEPRHHYNASTWPPPAASFVSPSVLWAHLVQVMNVGEQETLSWERAEL